MSSGEFILLMRRLLFVVASATLLTAAAVPPKGYPRSYSAIIEAARRERTLVVYSTTGERDVAKLLDKFRRQYPFIQLDYREIQSGELYQRVVSESRARKPTGDIAWSSAMDLQIKLVNDGYAQAYASPEKPHLPAWAIWKNEAYGVTAEPIVFVYNKVLVPPGDIPSNHQELLRLLRSKPPFYRGRVAVPDPERSGASYLHLTQDELANRDLWELAEEFGAVGTTRFRSSRQMLDSVAEGRSLIAYNVIGSYAMEWQSRDPRIRVVMPRDYTLVTSRIAIIPNEARHPNAAKLFLDFLLSRRGQSALSDQYMNPARGDVPVHHGSSPAPASARPVRVGPTLLANLDQLKRRRFLAGWAARVDVSEVASRASPGK